MTQKNTVSQDYPRDFTRAKSYLKWVALAGAVTGFCADLAVRNLCQLVDFGTLTIQNPDAMAPLTTAVLGIAVGAASTIGFAWSAHKYYTGQKSYTP